MAVHALTFRCVENVAATGIHSCRQGEVCALITLTWGSHGENVSADSFLLDGTSYVSLLSNTAAVPRWHHRLCPAPQGGQRVLPKIHP